MSKYNQSPVLRLNTWIENKLRGIAELGGSVDLAEAIIPDASVYKTDTDTDDNFPLAFFIPAGQNPETNTAYDNSEYVNIPFSTYSTQITMYPDAPWLNCGQITQVYYTSDVDKLLEISNYVKDLTKREDWSAYDINFFFRHDETYPFEFKTIRFIQGVGPIPAKDEQGRDSFMCTIAYDCTYVGPGAVGNYGDETSRGMWQ